MTTTTVAGELVEDLVRALVQMKVRNGRDGVAHLSGSWKPDDAAPVFRALMRVEAELLIEDADQLTAANTCELRTSDQRQADALFELVQRLPSASG